MEKWWIFASVYMCFRLLHQVVYMKSFSDKPVCLEEESKEKAC